MEAKLWVLKIRWKGGFYISYDHPVDQSEHRLFLCTSWSYTFNYFFFPLFCLQVGSVPVEVDFFFVFFWLFFIAPEWVSYQYRSLPSQQIKMKNAYHFLFLTRCLNHASVLLGLFSPLTHFNTYQLQVLVLPKILRMQIKIPFPKISILCFLTCF